MLFVVSDVAVVRVCGVCCVSSCLNAALLSCVFAVVGRCECLCLMLLV